MEVWKILSKWVICRFHFNLPGCKHHETFNPSTNQNLRLLTMSRTSITPPAHLKMAVKNQIPPTPYGKRTLPTLEEKETNFPNCKVFPWLQCINFNVAMYPFPTSKYFNVSISRSIYLAMSSLGPTPQKKNENQKTLIAMLAATAKQPTSERKLPFCWKETWAQHVLRYMDVMTICYTKWKLTLPVFCWEWYPWIHSWSLK